MKKKILLYVIAFISTVLLVLLILFFIKQRNTKKVEVNIEETTTTTTETTTTTTIEETTTLPSIEPYIKLKNTSIYSYQTLKDIIEDTNMQITNSNISLNTEVIGTHEITIKYNDNNVEKEYKTSYKTIDNIKPMFLTAAGTVNVLLGDTSNPCDTINIADNYTKVPTCKIEGNYNTNELGSYKVKYVISDENGNTNEKNLTINVLSAFPEPQPVTPKPTPPPTEFSSIVNKFKSNKTEFGIDVSKWQGDIDYNKVKNAGATFVLMRIAVSNKPDEALATDSKYYQNIERAKAAGLKVGVYVYTSAINDEQARETARYVVNALQGASLDYPIVYDWENWKHFREYQISIHDLNNTFIAFSDELKKHNLSSMLYGSKYYLENMWEPRIKNSFPIWLAHYTSSQTSYAGKYKFWQICSDGKIDGINGNVDIDILYK